MNKLKIMKKVKNNKMKCLMMNNKKYKFMKNRQKMNDFFFIYYI